jgi:type II secretory pathway pseudopilin PulG
MTLIEVMVAVSVIAIMMSGIALSIGVNYKAVALARSRSVAEAAANKRLEELRDVDYASMALSSQPVHSSDPDNPDYWVSADGTTYDVDGAGAVETLIVADGTGPITHLETPVTIGTTVVDIFQYVTWVDEPGIPGTENLKRLTVVVEYHSVPIVGGSQLLRESVILTPGTVSLGASATTSTSTTSTTAPSGTTTTSSGGSGCGSFGVAGSTGATVGYSASTTVTITMSMGACSDPNMYLNFSNDGGATWGPDVTWNATTPTVAWTLPSGDGTKTISGRARYWSGGTPWSLPAQSIILDTTVPTTPATLSRTVSCSGSTRTVNLSWSASTDTHLVGYHVYRSTDGATWSLRLSTAALTATDTNSKTLTSVRYYVTAYDAAGNNSNASPTITLSKNQCS